MSKDFYKKLGYIENNPQLTLDILNSVCGDFLGSGIHRDVYEYALDPDNFVVKVEKDVGGHNLVENRVWQAVRYTKYAVWFAPCVSISSLGLVLIQKKVKPIDSRPEKAIPDQIPAFFTDIKTDNFGWIDKQLVCFDYSFCLEKFSDVPLCSKTITTKGKLKLIK